MNANALLGGSSIDCSGPDCPICKLFAKTREEADTMIGMEFLVKDVLNNKDVTLSKKQYDSIIAAANDLVERAEANGLFDYTDGLAWDTVEGKNTIMLSVRRTITDGIKTYQWMFDIR